MTPARQPQASCNNCYDKNCGYACDIPCGDWKYEEEEITLAREKAQKKRIDEINQLIHPHTSAPARQPQQEYVCNDDDLGCLYDYMMAAMAGNDISELPRLWNQEVGVIKSHPHTSATAPAARTIEHMQSAYAHGKMDGAKAERERMIKLFDEIESGIKAYEKENEHQLVRDKCRGVYIPTNTIRRWIAPRKESLRQPEPQQEEGGSGGS